MTSSDAAEAFVAAFAPPGTHAGPAEVRPDAVPARAVEAWVRAGLVERTATGLELGFLGELALAAPDPLARVRALVDGVPLVDGAAPARRVVPTTNTPMRPAPAA